MNLNLKKIDLVWLSNTFVDATFPIVVWQILCRFANLITKAERRTHVCAKRAEWHFQRIGACSGNRRNLNYIRLVCVREAAAVCAVGCNTRQTESVY